ncbi:HNH endonuclease [Pandoraea terrigena]|uniref:Pathogenesis-related transcriptional factor and ERF protein n=1 Tax=Pandoraea terrigena TaxID=2508292 RepID=A0A5E4YZ65_9BURK|nr:HNH endonuclease [Pandoraea terrigena]VVE54159.1 pathogenesis-related transcriptional factor and ERF protein [Pandoraea terrigena]
MGLSFEVANRLLSYDPETGVITRKKFNAGKVATFVAPRGHLYVSCADGTYRAHRVAWLLYYGEEPNGILDHIDMDKQNNRIANLRIVGRSENSINRRINANNTSGYRGVTYNRKARKWQAKIGRYGVKNLGFFDTAEEAAHEFNKAAIRLHGEYAVLNPVFGHVEQSDMAAPRSNNRLGFRGVVAKPNGVYSAEIRVGYRKVHLGYFGTAEEAHSAYAVALASKQSSQAAEERKS